MNNDDIAYGVAGSTGQQRRRRGGLTGMVLAELREVAGGLGVDTTGLRRGDLITEIRKRQARGASRGGIGGGPLGGPIQTIHVDGTVSVVKVSDPARDRRETWGTEVTVGPAPGSDDTDSELIEINGEMFRFAPKTSDDEVLATVGPPPPARLLSLASLLLAPEERENWLGELRTARWELRVDGRTRRAVTWSFLRGLGASVVASWRHGGGPAQETS